ncbi:MAG: flagellar basal body-associated protein FliL, partial [Vibrio sp.]
MAEQDLATTASKGKSKLLLMIIAGVVLLLGVAGAAFFMLGSEDKTTAGDSQSGQSAANQIAPVAYV